jgi:hypothetical protein
MDAIPLQPCEHFLVVESFHWAGARHRLDLEAPLPLDEEVDTVHFKHVAPLIHSFNLVLLKAQSSALVHSHNPSGEMCLECQRRRTLVTTLKLGQLARSENLTEVGGRPCKDLHASLFAPEKRLQWGEILLHLSRGTRDQQQAFQQRPNIFRKLAISFQAWLWPEIKDRTWPRRP